MARVGQPSADIQRCNLYDKKQQQEKELLQLPGSDSQRGFGSYAEGSYDNGPQQKSRGGQSEWRKA